MNIFDLEHINTFDDAIVAIEGMIEACKNMDEADTYNTGMQDALTDTQELLKHLATKPNFVYSPAIAFAMGKGNKGSSVVLKGAESNEELLQLMNNLTSIVNITTDNKQLQALKQAATTLMTQMLIVSIGAAVVTPEGRKAVMDIYNEALKEYANNND